jgi:hypothetical protein
LSDVSLSIHQLPSHGGIGQADHLSLPGVREIDGLPLELDRLPPGGPGLLEGDDQAPRFWA